MTTPAWTARAAAVALLVVLAALYPGSTPPDPRERLALELRRLYAPQAGPGERWRRRAAVRLPDGREVARELAFRDDPDFVPAARLLLASRQGDDALLGAWLLGTLPEARSRDAEATLVEALADPDPRVVFEAAQALATVGRAATIGPLERTARDAGHSADVRTAAAWAAAEIARRESIPGGAAPFSSEASLAPGFERGVSWWMGEGRSDNGAASFRRLASLGVTWVSLHTWDPLQRGLADPVLAPSDRHFGFRDLAALVAAAHAAGLKVMVKPHLEMRGFEATDAERAVLRGSDSPARRGLVARFEAAAATGEHLRHNEIAMRSERDWQRWFTSYAGYILPYAREAQAAGADMFCVGRELDRTVVMREADWRRTIARIRAEFRGPLSYSANFDTWQGIGFWDALDFVGVSAYFPLSETADPSLAELEAGWERALAPLAAAARRFARPVLLTEAGFPSIPAAARSPWREEHAPADVWLQARCYEATLRALSRHPEVAGAFFWLWEQTSQPPFRDPSHAIVGKPASFTLARHFLALAEKPGPDPPAATPK